MVRTLRAKRKPERTNLTRNAVFTNGIAIVILAVAIACVYGRAVGYEFVNWDDDYHVSLNPDLNPPTIASVVKYWKGPQVGLYIPAVFTTWAALAVIGRLPSSGAEGVALDPAVFHTANLAVHLLTSWIVWQILRRLLCGSALRDAAAGAGALLFALHPLQVEPVVWVTGMKDLLCGCFALGSLLLYVIAIEKPDPPRDKARTVCLALATLAYALALLSKPSAACIPLMVVAIDRGIFHRTWKAILPIPAVWVAMAIVPVFLTRMEQVHEMTFIPAVDLRPFLALDAIGFYAGKVLAPIGLGIDHGRSPVHLIQSGTLLWSWIPGLVLCMAIWLCRKRFPVVVVPALLFVAGLSPVLGFSPFGFQRISTVADRYAYMAMIGPALWLAQLIIRFPRRGAWIAAALLIVTAMCISFEQTAVWENSLTLMTHALELNPHSPSALLGLGGAMHKMGNLPEATSDLQKAISIDPDDSDAHFNYGNVLYAEQDFPRAASQFEIAQSLNRRKGDARILVNLGAALAVSQRLDQSERAFRKAIAVNPQNAMAHSGLARTLEARGEFATAMAEYQFALALDPQLPQAIRGRDRILQMTH